MNTTTQSNSTLPLSGTMIDKRIPLGLGYAINCIIFVSVVVCIAVIVQLYRSHHGNFFRWPVIDRFSFYNILCDLLYYTAQVALGVNMVIRDIVFKTGLQTIDNTQCAIHAFSVLLFAGAQNVLSLVMAIYAFILVTKSRHINLGRYDYRLLISAVGVPFIYLSAAAFMNQFRPNIIYCTFKEEQGFLTWHFLFTCQYVSTIFLIILVVYLCLWIYVYRNSLQSRKTLQQASAVNVNRLAIKLSLYVLVHGIQFGGNVCEGCWISYAEPPAAIRYVSVLSSVTGGILNGLIYLIIRKR